MNLNSKFTKYLLIQKHRFHYMIRIVVLGTLPVMVSICHTSLSHVSYRMMELHMLLYVFQTPATLCLVKHSTLLFCLSYSVYQVPSVQLSISLHSCNICCELYTVLSLSQSPCFNSTFCPCITYQFIEILQCLYLFNGG